MRRSAAVAAAGADSGAVAAVAAIGVRVAMVAPVAIAALVAIVALGGCENRPESPARSNPFDPRNPSTGGDPLHVRAAPLGPAVIVSWDPVALDGLSGYRVSRRTDPDTLFTTLDTVGAAENAYADLAPPRDSVSHYLVTVLGAGGAESMPTDGARDSTDVPPLLEIRPGDGTGAAAETTSVRPVHVLFFSGRAERIFLANALDAASPRGLAAPESFPADPSGYPWTLTSGPGAEGLKTVYGRMLRRDGTLAPITFDAIRPNPIRLRIQVDGASADTARTGRRSVTMTILSAVGAESTQVALGAAPNSVWGPLETVAVVPIPADSLGRPARVRQTLRVRAKNNFNVIDSVRVIVEVDTLGSARILLNAGAAQTAVEVVDVHAAGGIVTAICLTNDSVARACPASYEPFDRVRPGWPLDLAQRGRSARVFAFLANEWDTTAAISDSIFFLVGGP